MEYVSVFFYYFKMVIQILFDHDQKLQEFNIKREAGGADVEKFKKAVVIERNLRFSLRNREEAESFLTDTVKSKLDFYKQLEDMIVPSLFTRNISFVMSLSNRLVALIDGVIDQVDRNFNKGGLPGGGSSNQMQSFKGWMKRFIVTNYEIYIDFFKAHSEFVA